MFLTKIAEYFGNGARQDHGYHGLLMEVICTWLIHVICCNHEWPLKVISATASPVVILHTVTRCHHFLYYYGTVYSVTENTY